MPLQNRVRLDGEAQGEADLRVSPAGVPISRFWMTHDSTQVEAGVPRKVRCRIMVVATGKALQPTVQALDRQRLLRVEGFLSRESYRREDLVVLHAERLQFLNTASED
jgi:primosomal replication protein N